MWRGVWKLITRTGSRYGLLQSASTATTIQTDLKLNMELKLCIKLQCKFFRFVNSRTRLVRDSILGETDRCSSMNRAHKWYSPCNGNCLTSHSQNVTNLSKRHFQPCEYKDGHIFQTNLLQGLYLYNNKQKNQRRLRISWHLKMGPIGCPKTSVRDYHYTLRKIPEERGSLYYQGMNLKKEYD